MPDNKLIARARFVLRAEKAFGLCVLPLRQGNTILGSAAAELPHRLDPVAPPVDRSIEPTRRASPISPTPAQSPVEEISDTGLAPLPVAQPLTSSVLGTDQKRLRLLELDQKEVCGCTRCRLCEARTHTVFGEGNPDAPIFFIGEGPGENEDLSGRPFVGKAGQLLDKMIGAMGLKRELVYIANLVKCRPPNNRVPAPDEVVTCTPYLERQLEIVRPQAIVTLGLPAAQFMLRTKETMGRLRGRWHTWGGVKLMPTYHPAYILRSYTPQVRAAVWDDLKKVLAEIGLPVP